MTCTTGLNLVHPKVPRHALATVIDEGSKVGAAACLTCGVVVTGLASVVARQTILGVDFVIAC